MSGKSGASESSNDAAAECSSVPITAKRWPIGYHHPQFTNLIKGTLVPYPSWSIMDEVSRFEATKDDIAICTFPKCGTTWLSAVVEMIRHDADPQSLHDGTYLDRKNPYLEFTHPDVAPGSRPIDVLNKQPPGRTFFTHLGYEALPESIKRNGTKIVCAIRNPKDAMVSMYHFFRSYYPMHFQADLQEVFNSFTEDRVMYGPFFDHAASFLSQIGKNPNIFFTSFEEMSQDFPKVARNLSAFLGKALTDPSRSTQCVTNVRSTK